LKFGLMYPAMNRPKWSPTTSPTSRWKL
jgi:hypothetical protein